MTDTTQQRETARRILTQFLVSQGMELSKAQSESTDQVSRTSDNLLKRILTGRTGGQQ